jgi:zinc D-Ala-D-Ala dipeptidase
MKTFYSVLLVLLFLLGVACDSPRAAEEKHLPSPYQTINEPTPDSTYQQAITETNSIVSLDNQLDSSWLELPDSAFVDLMRIDTTWVLDIRYATEDNFMNKAVYPCAKALMRKVVAEALLKAQKKFLDLGYSIKIHDAYRPLSVQWELWNSTDKKGYVANPTKGSNHNRGCAIDLTLIERQTGKELDMGTSYDFFGKKAHHTYTDFPTEVLENRRQLKTVMESVGFKSISNEWWHYDFPRRYPVSDFPLPCD